MGIRVHFYLAPPEGLSTLILEHIDLFITRLEALRIEYPDEFSEDVLTFAKQIKHDGIVALQAQTSEQAMAVDGFVMEISGNDEIDHILKPANDNWVAIRHYYNSRPWISAHCSQILELLWMFILEGRGIERDAQLLPFTRELDIVWRSSYWTPQECVEMLNELQPLTIPEVEPTFCVRIVREALQVAVDQQASMVILVN